MKYRFIDENAPQHHVRTLCRVLQVPSASYYQWVSIGRTRQEQREIVDDILLKKIETIHINKRRLYGSPRITDALRDAGTLINHKKVANVMRRAGIRAKQSRRFIITTRQSTQATKTTLPPDLVKRQFTAEDRNRLWTSDITYIWTRDGWLYLAIILDVFSRRIVGYQMSDRMTARLITDALAMAVIDRLGNALPLNLIFHSDRGSQYTSVEVRTLLGRYDIRQSMGWVGSCYDNAISESFFHTLKTELIQFEHYATRDEARRSIFEYIEVFYNRQRTHSAIGYRSPVQFELINNIS
jgi:transposase InsO family protein